MAHEDVPLRSRGRQGLPRRTNWFDLLQPHLAHVGGRQTRRLLRTALERLDRVGERRLERRHPPRRRRARFTSPRRAGSSATSRPGGGWPASAGACALARSGCRTALQPANRNERVLTVRREGDTLLLRETRDVVRLTRREREVLVWVARGKTNAQVAELLWLPRARCGSTSRTSIPSSASTRAPPRSPLPRSHRGRGLPDVATLIGKDAAVVLEIVAKAEAFAGEQPFTGKLLVELPETSSTPTGSATCRCARRDLARRRPARTGRLGSSSSRRPRRRLDLVLPARETPAAAGCAGRLARSRRRAAEGEQAGRRLIVGAFARRSCSRHRRRADGREREVLSLVAEEQHERGGRRARCRSCRQGQDVSSRVWDVASSWPGRCPDVGVLRGAATAAVSTIRSAEVGLLASQLDQPLTARR